MKALKQRNKSRWLCTMAEADALWDKVQIAEEKRICTKY